MAAAASTAPFERLPFDALTLIHSFLPVEDRFISQGNRAAQMAAWAMFHAPKLHSYPKDSFLGRLVIEMSSRAEVTNEAQLVYAVCSKVLTWFRQNIRLIAPHGLEARRIASTDPASFDEIDRLGNYIEKKKEEILKDVFLAAVSDPPFQEHLRELGLTNHRIPEGLRVAHFRTWMHKQLPATPLEHPLRYRLHPINRGAAINLHARDFQSAQGLFLGRVLQYALDFENARDIYFIVLQDASRIDPDYLGMCLTSAAINAQDPIVQMILESHRPINYSCFLTQALHSEGEETRTRLRQYFPEEVDRVRQEERALDKFIQEARTRYAYEQGGFWTPPDSQYVSPFYVAGID